MSPVMIKKFGLEFEKVQHSKTRDRRIPRSAKSKVNSQKSRWTNRIPSSDGGEHISPTARIRARYDALCTLKAVAMPAIQPGVEEAKRGPALRNDSYHFL